MRVLLVTPYPEGEAASQRFRVEQWLPELRRQGIRYKLAPFWGQPTWRVLYRKGHLFRKATGFALGFLRRLALLPQLPFYDFVLVHREATPVGPPWFEWLAIHVFRKKLIFDFDDAIWLPNTSADNQVAGKYKWPRKTAAICRWSYKVSCGNQYLQDFARAYNPAAFYLPTCLDTYVFDAPQKPRHGQRVVIGWMGSHSTLPYLYLLEPVLQQLEQHYAFDFLVIADKAPELRLRSLRFVPWRRQTELQDLQQLDIGVMPLPDTEWARGKCAFKALQYMALGIPAVVSAVGANRVAVPNGQAGYTCATPEEWYARLEELLREPKLREQLGAQGRQWVQEEYSVQAHRQTFLQLFT